MLVVGGGVVGCEFSNIFLHSGTKVTIVEVMPRILFNEDEEVSELLRKIFVKKGINVITDVTVENVGKENNKYNCLLSNGEKVTVDKILVSVGRKPNTENIGLKEVNIELDNKGFIKVDKYLRTNIKNIYAIGDVVGEYQLAHVASSEGLVAVENILGKDKEMKYDVVPSAIYTQPEIGTVGLGKNKLRRRDIKFALDYSHLRVVGKLLLCRKLRVL